MNASIGVGSGVTYQITAVRSTTRGITAQLVVNIGVPGGGGLTIESVTGATDKTSAVWSNSGPTRRAA